MEEGIEVNDVLTVPVLDEGYLTQKLCPLQQFLLVKTFDSFHIEIFSDSYAVCLCFGYACS